MIVSFTFLRSFKFFKKFGFLCFLIMVVTSLVVFGELKSPSWAATNINPTFHYQGKVTLQDGVNLLDGTPACVVPGANNDICDFRFRLFSQDSGGFSLWGETHSNIELGEFDGVFSVELGSVNGFNSLLQAFGRDDLYLEVSFDPDGNQDFDENNDGLEDEIFTPRQHLAAVPQAFTARQLVGVNDSMVIRLPGADYSYSQGDGIEWDTGLYFDDSTNQLQFWQDSATVGFIDFDTGALGTNDDFYIYDEVLGEYVGLGAQGTNNQNSGASLIGVHNEFSNSVGNNVQQVLSDLDQAIGLGGLSEGYCADGFYVIGFDDTGQMICGGGSDPLLQVLSVSMGMPNSGSTCALLRGGEVYCWGENGQGQLGIGDSDDRILPAKVPLSGKAVQLVSGYSSHYARFDDGQLWAWGANLSGELGQGDSSSYVLPQVVLDNSFNPLTNVIQVVASGDVTSGSACALIDNDGDRDGEVWCWGGNASGQVGNNSTAVALVAQPVQLLGGGNLDDIAALEMSGGSQASVCGLDIGGDVYCWGENQSGQLGLGTSGNDVLQADLIGGLSNVLQVASTASGGVGHRCALVQSGQVFCWGAGASGQLGNGSTVMQTSPVEVMNMGGVGQSLSLAGGQLGTSYVLMTSGTIRAWGYNSQGQLGNNNQISQSSPVAPNVSMVAGIVAAGFGDNTYACALLMSTEVSCWGYNGQGQLGVGDTVLRLEPTKVVGLSGVRNLRLGSEGQYGSSCAVQDGGTILCFGANNHGQLATGNTIKSNTPQYVKTMPNSQTAGGGSANSAVGGGLAELMDIVEPNVEEEVEASLLAQWPFNELRSGSCDGGQDICDVSGQNRHGVLNEIDGVTVMEGFLPRCVLGQDQCQHEGFTGMDARWGEGALRFDGQNDRVEISDSGSVLSVAAWSIDAWVNFDNCQEEQFFISKGAGLVSIGCRDNLPLAVFKPAGQAAIELMGSNTIQSGWWNYIAATWDNGQFVFYWNGVEIASQVVPATVIESSSDPLVIGQQWYSGCLDSCMATSAVVDNIRLIGRTLSAAEIFSLSEMANQEAVYTLNGTFLGIGTDVPEAELEVIGTIKADRFEVMGNWQIAEADDSDLIFTKDGLEKMRLTTEGFLGLGTSSPTERLTVEGNVVVTGDVVSGGAVLGDNLVAVGCPSGQYMVGFNADGYIECSYKQADLLRVEKIYAGEFTSGQACALMSDGRVACWGSSQAAGFGVGGNQVLPVWLPIGEPIVEVWLGSSNGFALAESGLLYAWGDNSFGQLGQGDTTSHLVPVVVNNLSNVIDLDLSQGESVCALEDIDGDGDGQVYCWGNNDSGQLGINSRISSAIPMAVQLSSGGALDNVVSLQMSGSSSGIGQAASVCAVQVGGSLYCWGENKAGQLGLGSSGTDILLATLVGGVSSVREVVGTVGSLPGDQGHDYRCALTTSGQVYCWGYNASGQVNGTPSLAVSSPDLVEGIVGAKQVVVVGGNEGSTYVVMGDGSVRAWGDNGFGQLADGSMGSSISGLFDVEEVVAHGYVGQTTVCARTVGGDVYCWGDNSHGQVGNGQQGGAVATPSLLLGVEKVSQLSLGGSDVVDTYGCLTTIYGESSCWGDNSFGQLASGSTGTVSIPVAVKTLSYLTQESDAVESYQVLFSGASYEVDGSSKPALTLKRGVSYQFVVDAVGHPFYISTDIVGAGAGEYTFAVEGSQMEDGVLVFKPNQLTPDTLYYQSWNDGAAGGVINVVDADQNYWDLSGNNLQYALGDVVIGNGSLCIDDGTGHCPLVGLPGHIYYSVAHSGYADIAENYPSVEVLEAGDVVSLTGSGSLMIGKSRQAYDEQALGVISTAPGMILGDSSSEIEQYAVALEGRVPVKILLPPGDYILPAGSWITSSGIPGYGMPLASSGPVIGKTLSPIVVTNTSVMPLVDDTTCQQVDWSQVDWPNDVSGNIDELVCYVVDGGSQVPDWWEETAHNWSTNSGQYVTAKTMMFVQRGFEITKLDLDKLQSSTAASLEATSLLSQEQQAFLDSLMGSSYVDSLLTGELSVGRLEVAGEAIFKGQVRIGGLLSLGADAAGEAEVLFGENRVEVSFSKPYDSVPVVSVSAIDYGGQYRVVEVSRDGFAIVVVEPGSQNIVFHWTAFGVDGGAKRWRSDGSVEVVSP